MFSPWRLNTQTISTHAPHARRGVQTTFAVDVNGFLLTRLMRGAARGSCHNSRRSDGFLLTRLMRGAANYGAACVESALISTHAPHARRGEMAAYLAECETDFYSRASCEARQDGWRE